MFSLPPTGNLFAFLLLCQLFMHFSFNNALIVDAATPRTNTLASLGNREQGEQLINGVVPSEARDFYANLTSNDRELLQQVLSKAPNYNSVGEVLSDLRNGSATLYDKAVNLVVSIRQTVAQLSPEGREFVEQSVEQIKAAMDEPFSVDLIKTQTNLLVKRFRALKANTKGELRAAFPMVSGVLDNSIVQMLATGILGIQGEEEANTD